jgi:hypothetical protein
MKRTVRETLTFGRFCCRAFATFLAKVKHLVAGRVCELGELELGTKGRPDILITNLQAFIDGRRFAAIDGTALCFRGHVL